MTAKPRRVLVVEDEMMVAMLVEDMLLDMGHTVIGPATRIEDGLQLAEGEIDVAILDMNLNGTLSFPIADVLRRRGVPFVFATGYGTAGLEGRYPDVPVVAKPFDERRLVAALESAAASFTVL